MSEVPPDDVPKSPSGRVPRWVLDEAAGIPPRDLVPFRGHTSTLDRPRPAGSGGRRWVKVTAWLVAFAALYVGADQIGWLKRSGSIPVSRASDTGRPPLGQEEALHPLGAPAPLASPGDGGFRFQTTQDDRKTPVTWSPCRPIHYVMRPDNAPADGQQLVDQGFQALSRATGLRFVSDGATKEGPSTDRRAYQKSAYGDRWAPVLVVWASSDEVPDFGVDIAGEAAAVPVATGSGDLAYVTGEVSFAVVPFARMRASGLMMFRQDVVLHELGHLVGLAHVNDPAQIMQPRSERQLDGYQAGDLAGLAKLGTGSCQPDV